VKKKRLPIMINEIPWTFIIEKQNAIGDKSWRDEMDTFHCPSDQWGCVPPQAMNFT